MKPVFPSLCFLAVVLLPACEVSVGDGTPGGVSQEAGAANNAKKQPAKSYKITEEVDHGRVEDHGGLRVLRLWGTAEERGTAHGQLVGAEAIELMRKELLARFERRKDLLKKARSLLPLMVAYPKDCAAEITALFRAVTESGVDLSFAGFDRDLDVKDALLVNAMDLVVQMGCSGFTVWGDQVEGGGVLTARNFDWPLTGPYLLKSCCLIVQHPEDGEAFASVAWPGYVGVVTGINVKGVATFLHVGNSGGGMPRPGSQPAATAARRILRQAAAAGAFEIGRDELVKTCPPYGYLTRVVSSDFSNGSPVRVFEADRKGVTFRKDDGLCVVTNHFLSRADGRRAGSDSSTRWRTLRDGLQADLESDDRLVSVAEAWEALAEVARGGRRFGTLHSLVFRHDPWVFELAIGELTEQGGVRAAPLGRTRYRLTRAQVFASIE